MKLALPAFCEPRSMVRTVLPSASVIFRVADATEDGTTTVPLRLLVVSTTALSPGAMTERPTSDDACKAWDEL
ncbi:hypothetical protein D3C85_1308490 [compost metagenome]